MGITDSAGEFREQLALPARLSEMLAAGTWVSPGDDVLRSAVPFIEDPLEFLPSRKSMLFNSGPLMGPDDAESPAFAEYRGSRADARELPWVDVEQMLVIACNKNPGNDVAIALDYRQSKTNPRVVGTAWLSDGNTGHIEWREISPSFESFLSLLGFDPVAGRPSRGLGALFSIAVIGLLWVPALLVDYDSSERDDTRGAGGSGRALHRSD